MSARSFCAGKFAECAGDGEDGAEGAALARDAVIRGHDLVDRAHRVGDEDGVGGLELGLGDDLGEQSLAVVIGGVGLPSEHEVHRTSIVRQQRCELSRMMQQQGGPFVGGEAARKSDG